MPVIVSGPGMEDPVGLELMCPDSIPQLSGVVAQREVIDPPNEVRY